LHDESTPALPPVVVTGGAGYVGSVLVRELLERGQAVRVLDNLLFGSESLDGLAGRAGFALVPGDVRSRADLDRALAGARAVVHLAGLVGDPLCALDPASTRTVNEDSSVPVAQACRDHGIERLVFASTCSVYGAAGDDWLDEDSDTAPVSLYAETNLRAEDLFRGALSSSSTTLTILRFATIYGLSPRMRYDLVVNLLTARALATGALEVHGGEQWRPQVHVRDVAAALRLALDQPLANAGGTFNVGSNEQNYRIRDLAETVASVFPGTSLTVRDVRDPRSYRVSFDRLRTRWSFRPGYDVVRGVREMADDLRRSGADAEEARFHNVRAIAKRLGSASA